MKIKRSTEIFLGLDLLNFWTAQNYLQVFLQDTFKFYPCINWYMSDSFDEDEITRQFPWCWDSNRSLSFFLCPHTEKKFYDLYIPGGPLLYLVKFSLTTYPRKKFPGLDFDGDANLLLIYDGVRCSIFLEKIIHNSCIWLMFVNFMNCQMGESKRVLMD